MTKTARSTRRRQNRVFGEVSGCAPAEEKQARSVPYVHLFFNLIRLPRFPLDSTRSGLQHDKTCRDSFSFASETCRDCFDLSLGQRRSRKGSSRVSIACSLPVSRYKPIGCGRPTTTELRCQKNSLPHQCTICRPFAMCSLELFSEPKTTYCTSIRRTHFSNVSPEYALVLPKLLGSPIKRKVRICPSE